MSNSYLTNAALIAGTGRDQGLNLDEVAEALLDKKARKAALREAAMARRAANEGAADFDFSANEVPAALAGFNQGNGGEDIEFGVDQADWQVAQADDKDIVARNRRRAEQAAKDIGLDQVMRGDNIIARNKAVRQLNRERKQYENPDGRTDWRMQGGDRIKEDPFLVGKRGADQNLLTVPEKQVRFMGRVDRDKEGNFLQVRHPHREVLEREPQFILGLNGGLQADDAQRKAIEADRGQARALRAQAAEREAGIYRETDIRRMIRDFENMENANAGVPGMAANQPFVGPLQNNGDVEEVRRRIIQERLDNPMRNLKLPVRQGFNSAADIQENIIRDELVMRGIGGEERLGIRRKDNDLARLIEAQRILNSVGIDELQMRDADVANIPTIKDVGNLKVKLPAKAGGFNEGQFFPKAVRNEIDVFAPYGPNNQGAHFDANGMPLGVQGPSPSNSVDPGQVVNAPRDVRQWAIRNAPSYKEGGRIFGDFPQVDIGGVGNDFLARIAKIKAKGQAFDPGVSAIRNIEDLEAVVNRFGDFQQAGGLKAFHLDANNKEVFVDRAGLPEIFQKMKMNANGQGRLANAIFQLEAAKANGVNNEQRVLFEKGLDQFGNRGKFADVFAPNLVNGGSGVENIRIPQAQVQFGARLPEFGNDEAQLQKIPRGQIQIGVDAVGKPIKQEMMAALQGLQGERAQPPLDANELRDARNGLVGLVQGEGRGRNFGFAKPIPEGADPNKFFRDQAIERAKPGKQPNFARVRENVARRQDIIDREKAARNAPNQVLGIVEPSERALQAKGVNFPQNRGAFVPEVNEGWKKDAGLFVNPGEPVVGNIDDMRRVMPSPAEARAVAPPPRVRAAGGGMRDGTRPSSVVAAAAPDPWQTPPGSGIGIGQQEKRMPIEMLNELAQLNSGVSQGPRSPGIRQKIMNSIKQAPIDFIGAPRRQRYGAAAGAALLGATGLSALIGGERNKREEEIYQ